jgi:hypothetical protein
MSATLEERERLRNESLAHAEKIRAFLRTEVLGRQVAPETIALLLLRDTERAICERLMRIMLDDSRDACAAAERLAAALDDLRDLHQRHPAPAAVARVFACPQ